MHTQQTDNHQMMDKKKTDVLWIVLFAGLLLLTLAGGLKSIFISADIDESYALTMGVRLARGDRLFLEMWEPHQLSAVLYSPLICLYLFIVGDTAEGLLVFMRIIGVLIQSALGLCLYRRLSKNGAKKTALLAAFFYVNFTPKHIQSPEFTSLFYWGMTAFLLLFEACLNEKNESRKRILAVCAGLFMCVMVLCYPASVIIFLLCICLLLKQKNRSGALFFGSTCVVTGLWFLIRMIAKGSFLQALSNLPNVLSDVSHKQSVLLLWKEHLTGSISMLWVSIALMVLVFCARPVLDRKKEKTPLFWGIYLALQGIWMLVQFHSLTDKAYYDYLPVILQLFAAALFYVASANDRRPVSDEKTPDGQSYLLWIGVPCISTLCILGLSNLPAAYSVGFLLPAVLYLMPVVAKKCFGKAARLQALLAIFFLLILTVQIFAVRIGLVRFSGNQRRTIMEDFYKVNHGPLAGIRLGAEDWKHHDEMLHCYVEDCHSEDVWLYVGADFFIYPLLSHEQVGTGNTISTPAFSEQLLSYYEQFPERVPTVMVVEHDYVHDYSDCLGQEPFASFVKAHFDLANPTEKGSVSVYRKKP
ncbi:MAG: hypothetical protein K6E18_04040 [Lachnospiraceae bacterium]|nr:hypothetical protein [Lachnospiraceae bacterium]